MLDYVLGINIDSFVDFEQRLSSTDPGELHRLATIRQTAIDTCSAQLLTDGETSLHAWTLLAPSDETSSTVPTHGYEEKVVILSRKAVYVVSYEYSLQKVGHIT